MEVIDYEMTAEEMARAHDWLLNHGHTHEELVDFTNYIARRTPREKTEGAPKAEEQKP